MAYQKITGIGVTDGDKGDIVVSGSGTSWALDYSGITIASSGTTGFLKSTDFTTFNNKLDNNSWIDYSGTSTITGWSSYTLKQLKYKIVGNMMFVNYAIYGTSNSATTSFTLPNNSVVQTENTNRCQNNGVWYHGYGIILSSASTVTLGYWTAVNNVITTWTASGNKVTNGILFFEI